MMRSILPVVAMLFVSACMGGGGGTGVSAAPPPLPPTEPVSSGFGTMLNQIRTNHSVSPLTQDDRLTIAAQLHANDMYGMQEATHIGSDGLRVWERMENQGYDWIAYGENVAQGPSTEASVLAGWEGSPLHHNNNVNSAFEDFGIAKAGVGNQTYWALVFGTEARP